ncbi:MAG: ribonuclease HI [Solirubrobacteraceae bacterium]
MSSQAIQLWTDGACAGNPGPGGWAALLIEGTNERMLSGGEVGTTNNRMELLAPIKGLQALTRPSLVDIYIDSTYVMYGFTKDWVVNWRRLAVDGVWRTSSQKPVRNQELWVTLAEEVERHTFVDWHRVPGHSGIELNERVDVEAVVQRDLFSRRAR